MYDIPSKKLHKFFPLHHTFQFHQWHIQLNNRGEQKGPSYDTIQLRIVFNYYWHLKLVRYGVIGFVATEAYSKECHFNQWGPEWFLIHFHSHTQIKYHTLKIKPITH